MDEVQVNETRYVGRGGAVIYPGSSGCLAGENSGWRKTPPVLVGSHSLKGGGKKGVGAASMCVSSSAAGAAAQGLLTEAPVRLPRRRAADPLLSSPFQGEGPDRCGSENSPAAASSQVGM
jgi:hypothetical protein